MIDLVIDDFSFITSFLFRELMVFMWYSKLIIMFFDFKIQKTEDFKSPV